MGMVTVAVYMEHMANTRGAWGWKKGLGLKFVFFSPKLAFWHIIWIFYNEKEGQGFKPYPM
jgi:hypothetical protein